MTFVLFFIETDSLLRPYLLIEAELFVAPFSYLNRGAFVTFARASTGSVNHTVTSISSPAPKGPLAAGLVVVMFVTSGVSVDTTISRFAPSEQPLNVTHVPGSGRLALAAVAP